METNNNNDHHELAPTNQPQQQLQLQPQQHRQLHTGDQRNGGIDRRALPAPYLLQQHRLSVTDLQPAAQMQQLVQPPGPLMGYDFFAHANYRSSADANLARTGATTSDISRYQQPRVMMQMQQSPQHQVPRRPSLSLGGPSLSSSSTTTNTTTTTSDTSASGSTSGLLLSRHQHHQDPMRTVNHTNNVHNTVIESPMMAPPPTNTTYMYPSSSSSSNASLHQRQQQETCELKEKERRLCELRQEQERLRRIKQQQREAVGKAQQTQKAKSSNRHEAGADKGYSSCSSASAYDPSSVSATRNTASTSSKGTAVAKRSFLLSPRPASIGAAASADPNPYDNNMTVHLPPATTVNTRQLGWFICTLCKSKAFSSESDLADHQATCASNDTSTAETIRASLAAQEEAQARAQAELRERLSSAKAQVAALQQQIQQTRQQMVPMSHSIAGPMPVYGGASSSISSQPMVCMTANNNESGRINNSNKTHLDSLGIEDVTHLAMREMTDDGHRIAANNTEHQKQPPSSMTALTSSTTRQKEPIAEFCRDEIVLGERLENPIPLGIPLDKDMLTPLHCFIREHCVQVSSWIMRKCWRLCCIAWHSPFYFYRVYNFFSLFPISNTYTRFLRQAKWKPRHRLKESAGKCSCIR